MNTGLYKFIANVFNLPSNCMSSNYDTLDGHSKDGLLHDILIQIEYEFQQRLESTNCINPIHREWLSLGVHKSDEMKIKEKLCFNPHEIKLVGFVDEAINNGVIKVECSNLVV